ncbi:MAG: phage holin family protein [bacterium]|nr:phage holin family protein [bacterium]
MEPKKILFYLFLTTASIYLLANFNLIPGVRVNGFYSAFVVASLMGLLSIAARTFLVTFKVPLVLLTLWLFTVVLNTAILWFISQFMDHEQFVVEGLLSAFFAAVIISIAQFVAHKIIS